MRPTLAIVRHASTTDTAAVGLASECCSPSGVEVTARPGALHAAVGQASRVRALSGASLGTRLHFQLCHEEISHRHAGDQALESMKVLIDLMSAERHSVMTMHAALPSASRGTRRLANARSRIAELVAYGAERSVTVCLENLRWGLTSEPDAFVDLVQTTGARVTFDVGHAVSSDAARAGHSAETTVRELGELIEGAHVYGHEDEAGHHAPEDLQGIAPALEALCDVGCPWWTIELTKPDDVRHTRALLSAFLDVRYPSRRLVTA